MNNVDIYTNYMEGLQIRVIEDRHIGNYAILCFNCLWIARDVSPHDATKFDICNLATNIISRIKEVRAFKGLHGDMIEGIWKIIERQENESKKIRLVKKQSVTWCCCATSQSDW